MSRHAQFIMWGGSRYDTLGSINKVVKPPEVCVPLPPYFSIVDSIIIIMSY